MEELLQPQPPLNRHHQAQLDFLRALPAAQRPFHARLFHLGNATYRYQKLATGEVTEADYQDWLEGLPTKVRAGIERDGFEKSNGSRWPELLTAAKAADAP